MQPLLWPSSTAAVVGGMAAVEGAAKAAEGVETADLRLARMPLLVQAARLPAAHGPLRPRHNGAANACG